MYKPRYTYIDPKDKKFLLKLDTETFGTSLRSRKNLDTRLVRLCKNQNQYHRRMADNKSYSAYKRYCTCIDRPGSKYTRPWLDKGGSGTSQ